MTQLVNKRVTLDLVGLDGNAFNLMGKFQKQARREGWTAEEISLVIKECQAGDYDHLLSTLMNHTQDVERDEDEDDY